MGVYETWTILLARQPAWPPGLTFLYSLALATYFPFHRDLTHDTIL
jgi:hypothetical protein